VTPKRHFLAWKHVILGRQNRSTGAGSGQAEELSKKRRYTGTKKPQHVTSHVFAETTHVVAPPYGFACMVTSRRSYILQVSSKSIQGFLSPWGLKFAHSHYFGCRLYNSLHYRASRDYRKKKLQFKTACKDDSGYITQLKRQKPNFSLVD